MMAGDGQYGYLRSESGRFTAIAMPYKDERYQMILVLPDQGASVGDTLNQVDADAMYKQMRHQEVEIKFPKFRVQTKLQLTDVLKRVGVRQVFTSLANLQRMSPDPRLYVSDARHSAIIETDERGSEAAAATSISISARSFFTAPTPSFVADRPFLFYVYDVTSANVLFSGQVADAAAAQAGAVGAAGTAGARPVLLAANGARQRAARGPVPADEPGADAGAGPVCRAGSVPAGGHVARPVSDGSLRGGLVPYNTEMPSEQL
ncbi:serpin I2-like [Pollicipes pollicipes]|uniref:serpin I2-like n=1 Tax=Pollicipes pollicipes TaxID=41117 RepID=UPI001884B61F|nr:serpin I2-like [Pollicipes pollicipes]